MALEKHWIALATALKEQSTQGLSHSDIRRQLQDALTEQMGMGCYVMDVYGDDQSGDVVYCGTDGDCYKTTYEISATGAGRSTVLGDPPTAVLPRTVYDDQVDELGHMAQMERRMRFDERFVSKTERSGAGSSDFAGKNRSFPIMRPEDVMAAVRSMGRAGAENYNAATLKANIIKIAKRKGWSAQLPKAWQESAAPAQESAEEIELVGDALLLREGAVGQDGTAFLKLIAPGRGSSGFYPEEVLKRDGGKAFPKGTKSYWNHATAAEEAARPEGNLRDLASVLTEDAHWMDNGPAGNGLYAKAKVFEHYRQPLDQLAKHIGVSIRAAGTRSEKKAPDGKPGLIEQITRGISVDYVTEPGAGGEVLTLFEAARRQPATEREEEDTMDEAAIKKLIETATAPLVAKTTTLEAENLKLKQHAALNEAARQIDTIFSTLDVTPAIKARVKGRLLAGALPISEAGELDAAKLKTLAEAELKGEAEYVGTLTESGQVRGMGAGTRPPEVKPEEVRGKLIEMYTRQGMPKHLAEVAAVGRA